MIIRTIQPSDNSRIAAVIRDSLEEFGVNLPGTVYTDPTTDALFELFQTPRSKYWIAEINGIVLGGCGVFPTPGLPKDCAELVKLYLDRSIRGMGIGKLLMEKSIESAKELGYKSLYLESLPELNSAVSLYEKLGFTHLSNRLGESGHFACNLWMMKTLE